MEDTKKWARGSCDRLSRSRLQEDEEEEPTKVRLGLSADNSDFDMSTSSIGVTKRRKSSFMVEPTKLRKRPREGSENLGYISSSSSNNKGNRGQIRDQIVMMKNQSKMMHPRNGIYSRFFSILAAAATLSILTVSLINNNQISAQATTGEFKTILLNSCREFHFLVPSHFPVCFSRGKLFCLVDIFSKSSERVIIILNGSGLMNEQWLYREMNARRQAELNIKFKESFAENSTGATNKTGGSPDLEITAPNLFLAQDESRKLNCCITWGH